MGAPGIPVFVEPQREEVVFVVKHLHRELFVPVE